MIAVKRIVSCFVITVGLALLGSSVARAASTDILIDHIQAGAVSAATQEYIALYNNSDQAADVTGWCLASKNTTQFGCVTATKDDERIFIKPRGYLTITSDTFAVAQQYAPDSIFLTTNKTSGSLTASGDVVAVMNSSGQVVDTAEWSATLEAGVLLRRQILPETTTHLDTGSPTDFVKQKVWVIPPIGAYEEVTVIDVCSNIAGAQITVPDGMTIDSAGMCTTIPIDQCPNLPGVQPDLLTGRVVDVTGDCVQDTCDNIDGVQTDMPNGYMSDGSACRRLPRETLRLTELLPNAAGDDTGREFIELYNPNNVRLSFDHYRLVVGMNKGKTYAFPEGVFIEPHAYYILTNETVKYTLANTGSQVQLVDDSDNVIDQSPPYDDAKDDMAWALIEGEWQYTNQLTPSESNLMSLTVPPVATMVTVAGDTLTPCEEGKYRNPITHRCRSLVTDTATLTPCDSDEYRSFETNRCRKVVATAAMAHLIPCKDGQYRSEETNRCRTVTTAAARSVAPCKEGQERNPETNRCRAVTATAVPAAAFAVEPIRQSGKAFIGWWALGGIGSLAAAYGVWEWRRELVTIFRSMAKYLPGHK